MAYRLEPFQLNNNNPSDNVFFLCDGKETPLDYFHKKSGDNESVAKLEVILQSISTSGISRSFQRKRIKRLRSKIANDLCEIRVQGTAVRAFSFSINGNQAIAIDFIRKVHSGSGQKATQDAIRTLVRHRNRLEEALERRKGNASE